MNTLIVGIGVLVEILENREQFAWSDQHEAYSQNFVSWSFSYTFLFPQEL